MTANVTLTNYLLLKRANTSVSSTYTGLVGEITIDTDLDTVRVHDGVTAGGHILANVNQINDSGNLSSLNANVSAANVQIDSLRANITAANVQITTLIANAAAQQVQINNFAANTGFATVDQLAANINIVNANVGAFQIFSNANAGTQATSINNLNANIGAYQTFANANVVAIQANLGAYQNYANTNTGSLQANLGAYQTYANANAAIQANELNNLSANAGVQATSINLLNANVTAANSAITTLTANAATQAGLITTVNANVTAANAAIASLQSNAAVQQGVLDVLSGNAVTQTLELQQLTSNAAVQAANLIVLLANAASQESSLIVLVSNAAAQSTAIDNINSNVGAYQIYANANAAAQATSITTLLSNAAAQALSLDSLTTNAATQGASIINLDANLGTVTTNITALQANAGTQGAAINSITANVGAYQTFANANAAVQANSLTTLIANAATQAQSLDGLTSNAATQAASINTIDANLGAATTNITSLQSNAGSQAAAINNINANVGAYQTYANANAAAQAASISSLTANAAAQQLQIDSFVTGTGFALLTQLTANVDTINANIGAYQTYANANAAGQTTEINSLRANITAANTLIPNLSAVSGNILPSANVTYSLGSAQFQWKDLWVSNNTIYIGNTPVRVDGGTLLVNGAPVTGGSYNNSNVATYLPTYTGNIAGNIVKNGYTWAFGTDGTLTFPTGGNLIFDSSATSIIDGVTDINAVGTIGANVIQVLSDLTSFGASPAPRIYGFSSIATTGSAVNEGNISASGNLVASRNAYVTGNVFAARYNFANGVNILSTVGAGSYGNTEVAAYLPTYTGNVGAARVQVTNAVDFMYGGFPYMGWQLSGSDTLKLRTNIASGDYTNDAVIVDRQSLAVNVVATLSAGNIITTSGVFWSNGVAYSSGGSTYGNTEVAAYLLTYPNANFATLNTTSANITTVRAANFNTANAVITGGYATGLANISVTGNVTVGNLIGTSSNTTIVAGNYSSRFDTVGNVVLPSAFVSGNATVMGIAPGYAPNRPAFRIYGSSSNNWTTSNINFKGSDIVVDYNQGNYFNSTTGVFTAPVAGLYSITLNARIGNNNGQNQIMVLKNGLTSAGNVAVMWECDTNTGTAVHYGVSSVMKLAAGDFLTANITVGNIQFDANDSWTVTYLG